MNLKKFYQRIREVEAAVLDAFPIVVSAATPDGGKAGTLVEVSRALAARMIVQGLAQLAEEAEAKLFRTVKAEAKKAAEEAAAAAKLQLTVMTAAELNKLKSASKPTKD